MTDLTRPLDLDHPGADAFLQGIQGDIIKGHGRVRTAHILLAMTGDPAAVRSWVADFAAQQVTTAHRARQAAIAWRAEGGFGEPFAMLLLAPDGYRYLGFTDGQLPQPYDRFRPGVGRREFLRGMKGPSPEVASGIGDDPPYAEWEAPYQRAIHAMILLADDDEHRLDGTVADVCASLSGVFEELTIERGKALKRKFTTRGERELTIEHFGFQDGVSQPIVVQQDLDAELARRGGTQWNPGAPLSLALAQEPRASDGYGSFMVFRSSSRTSRPFGQRSDGRRCPFHAHIRKTNPRGDIPRLLDLRGAEFERSRRIVRRGITYGDRPDLADGSTLEPPSAGVGLLFMCFQASLDQFFIQQDGADSNDFVQPGVGLDAVIGHHPDPVPQTWPSTATTKFTMSNFVTMLGGEYFFAPSIAFLTGGMLP